MQTNSTVRLLFEQQRDRKPARGQKIFIAVYLLVGLAGITAAIIDWVLRHGLPLFFLLVGLPYTALGFYFIKDLHNERVCAKKMLQDLEEGGASLAWMFIENEHGQREACLLHYYFTDRRHGTLCGPPPLIREVFDFFSFTYPMLSTGYSSELERHFRRDPRALKARPVRFQVEKETNIEDNPSNGW